jgi:hypothetical protein
MILPEWDYRSEASILANGRAASLLKVVSYLMNRSVNGRGALPRVLGALNACGIVGAGYVSKERLLLGLTEPGLHLSLTSYETGRSGGN